MQRSPQPCCGYFDAGTNRATIGRRGRDWVLGHFNAGIVAEQTLRVYGEIAGPAMTAARAAPSCGKFGQSEHFDWRFRPTFDISDGTALTSSPFLPIFRYSRAFG